MLCQSILDARLSLTEFDALVIADGKLTDTDFVDIINEVSPLSLSFRPMLHQQVFQLWVTLAKQKAVFGLAWREHEQAEAKKRQGTSTGGNTRQLKETFPEGDAGQARDKIGERVGVSGKSIDKAALMAETGEASLAATWKSNAMTSIRSTITTLWRPGSSLHSFARRGGARPRRKSNDPLL